MQLPLAYLDATAIEEVAIDLWKEVFDAVGWPASLTGRRDNFDHEGVLSALERDAPTDELLQALEVLSSLGTEAGRDAIMAAMNDRRVDTGSLPSECGEREFALRLFLAQRSSAPLADVFARAQTEVQESAARRRYNEFFGKEARAIRDITGKRATLQEDVLRFCQRMDLGDHVNVRAFADDSDYLFHVIRSHHTKKPLVVIRGHKSPATIEYRPVHSDIIRYDAANGSLRVTARAAPMVEFYRHTFGNVLFGDSAFFSAASVCSLRVVQERGRAAFDGHNMAGIGRVWMTECLWERGDRDVIQLRSRDCFRQIEELRLSMSEGELVQAKLKIEVVGRSTRPLTVNVRTAASSVEVSQALHEELIYELLTKIGIRNPRPNMSAMDLWSLFPWRHPVEVWRVLFGNHTDALVRQGVLIPIQLNALPSPQHHGAGRVLTVQAVDTEYYGVSSVPEISSRSLTPTDLDGLELDPERLRIYLRHELNMSGANISWDGGDLVDLGVIDVHGGKFHFSYALRDPRVEAATLIRTHAAGAHAVLLLPSSRVTECPIPKVLIEAAVPSRTGILHGAIMQFALESQVPAIHFAPAGVRLVVDSRFGIIWIDGAETKLKIGTQPFRFVELLAARSPSSVSSYELAEAISGVARVNSDGDTAVRQAKTAVRKQFVEALASIAKQLQDDPFPTQKGQYRCAIPAFVV